MPALKPVTPIDQGFLWLERRNQPMHVGGLLLLRPPADAGDDYIPALIERTRRATGQPATAAWRASTTRLDFGEEGWRH